MVILGSEYLLISSGLSLVSLADFLEGLNFVTHHTLVAELLKQVPFGLTMKQDVATYWRKNIFETSSGNFATNLLKFHIEEIGLKQIMYSIDYPYVRTFSCWLFFKSTRNIHRGLQVNIKDGTTWIDTLPRGVLDAQDFASFSRGLAIDILRLND